MRGIGSTTALTTAVAIVTMVSWCVTATEATTKLHRLGGTGSAVSWKNTTTLGVSSSSSSSSCASHADCQSCYESSSFCHWCAFDEACHAKGSMYGCSYGVSCEAPPKPPKNDTDPQGCYRHTSCSDCALASRFCHWCAHDNACHVIGSVYGCVSGVDCYSNDRCQRDKPEPIPIQDHFRKLNVLYLVILIVVLLSVMCLVTCCCGIVTAIKAAYEDIADAAHGGGRGPNHLFVMDPDNSDEILQQQQQQQPLLRNGATEDPPVTSSTSSAMNQLEDGVTAEEVTDEGPTTTTATAAPTNTTEEAPLVPSRSHDEHVRHYHDYLRFMTGSQTSVSPDDEAHFSITEHHAPYRPRRHRAIRRIYHLCVCLYVATLLVTTVLLGGVVWMYPKVPQYNVCNDAVAWKSIMDSITNLQPTADFEILASVANPNHFDVALDSGKGSFTHNGVFVGTFDIPPQTFAGASITDVLLVAHISPEKWEALSLATDYYRGKLVIEVKAVSTLRVPMFWDWSYTVELNDVSIHVNDQSDRHLCACPTWDDGKNKSSISFHPPPPPFMAITPKGE